MPTDGIRKVNAICKRPLNSFKMRKGFVRYFVCCLESFPPFLPLRIVLTHKNLIFATYNKRLAVGWLFCFQEEDRWRLPERRRRPLNPEDVKEANEKISLDPMIIQVSSSLIYLHQIRFKASEKERNKKLHFCALN